MMDRCDVETIVSIDFLVSKRWSDPGSTLRIVFVYICLQQGDLAAFRVLLENCFLYRASLALSIIISDHIFVLLNSSRSVLDINNFTQSFFYAEEKTECHRPTSTRLDQVTDSTSYREGTKDEEYSE